MIECDKDDVDVSTFMNVSVLALGMLTCIPKGLDFLVEHKDVSLGLVSIRAENCTRMR